MGKIGNFEYPQHSIEECADIVETIDEYNITKQDLLAEKLGHSSPDSGAFRNKITSLRRYGLLSGRGDINLSQTAERIVNPAPNSNERKKAMGRAMANITLFSKLYERLGDEPPDDDFWFHLVEVTDVERSEAKDKAGRLGRLYSTGLPYLSALNSKDEEETAERTSSVEDDKLDGGTMSENVDASIKTRDYGEIKIRDKDTLDLARNLLDLLEKQYDSNDEGVRS